MEQTSMRREVLEHSTVGLATIGLVFRTLHSTDDTETVREAESTPVTEDVDSVSLADDGRRVKRF